MKIIVPLDYSNIESITPAFNTENYNNVWTSGASYNEANIVIYPQYPTAATVFPEEWYCFQAHTSTTLNTPGTSEGDNFWSSLGYSNKFAAFDRTTTKKSILNVDKEVYLIALKPGTYVNSIAILNSEVGKILVTNYNISTTSTAISTHNNYQLEESSAGWFNYVQSEYNSRYQPFIVTNMSTPTDKQYLQVEISKPQNILNQNIYDSGGIGELILGNVFEVGWTQRGISSSITDYSVKESDIFGNTTFVERNFTKTIGCQVLVQNKYLNSIQRVFYNLRAKPCVWIPTNDENLTESTIIYGYYKNFSLELSYPDYSIYNIEIEGLT